MCVCGVCECGVCECGVCVCVCVVERVRRSKAQKHLDYKLYRLLLDGGAH
jgi:hypothetical protein